MNVEEIAALVLEKLDTACYVSDMETHELVYLNAACRALFGVRGKIRGRTCHAVLYGRDTVCEFCAGSALVENSTYRQEQYNSFLQKTLSMADTMAVCGGRRLHIQHCVARASSGRAAADTPGGSLDHVLFRCVRSLSYGKNTKKGIQELLTIIGEYYQAKRAHLFEFDFTTETMGSTYEWCAPGVSRSIDGVRDMPLDRFSPWITLLEKTGVLKIMSVENEISPDTPGYEILVSYNIQRLFAAPLFSQKKAIGFLSVMDPQRNLHDTTLLQSAPFFIHDELLKRRMIEDLERLSYVDALTGVYNRNKYVTVLKEFSQNFPETLGTVYLDLNGLKSSNDTYGHEYGDSLILDAAKSLTRHFGKDVFRVGGDEFVVLCKDIKRSSFVRKIAALRKHIDQGAISAAIGSNWACGGVNIEEQVRYADELMYIEKQNYYKSQLVGQASQRSRATKTLLEDIKKGLFCVYLQPRVELHTGKVVGAEALVRRKGDASTVVGPAQFLPMFELEGVIRHIDFFVLNTVCTLLKQWKKTEKGPLPVSVNFSRLTMMERNIVEKISAVCQAHEVEPSLITIEVTENIVKMDAVALEDLLRKLHKAGFTVSLDNFGADFSALAILATLDFDEIKFDKSLINTLVSNPKSCIVMEYALGLCSALPSTLSLAEGVESKEHAIILSNKGCNLGQGYYYSSPLPAQTFWELFAGWDEKAWT